MLKVNKVKPASGFSVVKLKNHLPKLIKALAITLPIVTSILNMFPNIPLMPPIMALIRKIKLEACIYVLF